MKKPIIAIAAVLAFSLASCKKDYTCECKKIVTDEDGNSVTSSDGTYTFKDSRARAETKCNDQEKTSSGGVFEGESTRECQIK